MRLIESADLAHTIYVKALYYPVKFAGNLYWKLFGGVALCVIWFALGAIAAATIVGAPFAAAFFRIGRFVYKPFGKRVVIVPSSPVLGILWAATGGTVVGVISVVAALLSAATVVALPIALQWIKVAVVSVFPFSVGINKT